MNKQIFKFLKDYNSTPHLIDRLIISAFLHRNEVEVKNNRLILSHLISNNNKNEYLKLNDFINMFNVYKINFGLEELIELFEFVISPSDKILNGAVYTPNYIRNYIVEQSLNEHTINQNIICGDISCGCGGFLLTLSNRIKTLHGKSFYEIYRDNIYGVDITDYSIHRAKLLLTINAIIEGEDKEEFIFNLERGNSLDFNFKDKFPTVNKNCGFDLIVGNPPYVCSRNMDQESINLLDKWEVTKSGHPDLYIPFFQIGLENLNARGILGYITVNTFFKSINGRSLRQYFAENNIYLLIVNFGSEQVFKDRSTYTCLCFLKKSKSGKVLYNKSISKDLDYINSNDFYEYDYSTLNHYNGWNLVSSKKQQQFIKLVESTGTQLKDKFTTRNGIATLKNSIYKFFPTKEDKHFFYMESEGKIYPIEKKVCRGLINSNKISTVNDIRLQKEQIIFPYEIIGGKPTIIKEDIFISKYPKAYNYLYLNKTELSKRDKGNKKYEAWYAYGRNQSLDINSYKLFFPHICERPKFILCRDRDLLFYNGLAILSDNLEQLKILKIILESGLFYEYIKHTSKDYSSGYISLSKNYIKNFGISNLTPEEKKLLQSLSTPYEIDSFLSHKYNLADIITS